MRIMPNSVFGRLVLGLVIVSICAVALATAFLYTRFHDKHSFFYEGTLQSFAGDIRRDVKIVDGKAVPAVRQATIQRILGRGGRFVIVDFDGTKLAGSEGTTGAFVSPQNQDESFFWIPKTAASPELFGISAQAGNADVPVFVQVALPIGHAIFESVLHEFMQDIAWLWIPFLLVILITNVIVVRLALRPLAATVEEARAIQPGGVTVSLSEKGLPQDILAVVRTVNEAFGRLRLAIRTQEEFVADMAHELRTPIAVMKAQLAPLHVPVATILSRDLDSMGRLVEQLLDRARLGKLKIEPGDFVDLYQVAREAAAFLAPRIVARGRTIEVIAPGKQMTVSGGQDDLFRAVRNLIENAVEYSPEGGLVSVTVTDTPAIVVTDRGNGFPQHALDDERRRSGTLRSDRREGAGLGLSIVERTMQAHGGQLKLSNPPEGGARAEMRFKLDDGAG